MATNQMYMETDFESDDHYHHHDDDRPLVTCVMKQIEKTKCHQIDWLNLEMKAT